MYSLVLFSPLIGPYQVLPIRTRMYLGAMVIKGYSAFPKAHGLLELQLFSAISRTLVGWVLPLCREAVDVFYSPNRLGQLWRGTSYSPCLPILSISNKCSSVYIPWESSFWGEGVNPFCGYSHRILSPTDGASLIFSMNIDIYDPIIWFIFFLLSGRSRLFHSQPVGGCKIHWLQLCRRVRLPCRYECPGYKIKQSEAPVILEL